MKNTFKDTILGKIKEENIEPLPESYFTNKQRLLWMSIGILLFFAMFFGGFLFDNISEFLGMQGYRWREWNYFLFPNIVWIFLLVLLFFMGVRRFKDTPTGYRNSYWKDVLIGAVIIFLGALILRGIGAGPMMHAFVANDIPVISDVLYNGSSWSAPENGRLAGKIVRMDVTTLQLRGMDGKIWEIHTGKALISPRVVWKQGEKIRVLWRHIPPASFEAERVLPWFGKWMGNHEWFRERREMMR